MATVLRDNVDTLLASGVWRGNPDYELIAYDHLPAAQQGMFSELAQRPDAYGILRPRDGSGLSVKAVTRDTALLFLTLRQPGVLPKYARPATAEQTLSIVRLVLDQILQIQHDDRFVAGADAYALLYGTPASTGSGTRLQQISIAALKYGQALAVNDVFELSMRLYNYHRIPLSDAWRDTFPSSEHVRQRLGVAPGGPYTEFVNAHWVSSDTMFRAEPDSDADGWFAWTRRRSGPLQISRDGTYKLYISPLPDLVEHVFAIALRTLTEGEVLQFKIGADVEGLLRPDKMVAYFASLDALREASERLAKRLDGCPAHGVPFSSELAGDGLLSWGVDPPASERLVNWQPQESWRLWLTNRLANALLTARMSGSGTGRLEPWQYALERLSVEGIDTTSWTPSDVAWRRTNHSR